MKIKRYFASDMRQAIRQVRESQGPDAVILSSRKVDGGIEIIATVDYDEDLVAEMASQRAPADALPKSAASVTESARHDRGRALTDKSVKGEGALAQLEAKAQASAALGLGQRVPTDAEIDEAYEDGQEINSEWFVPVVSPPKAAKPRPERVIEWTQDPTLISMRQEIETLRGMLQDQLSSLAWQDLSRREPWRVHVIKRLREMGIGEALSTEIGEALSQPLDNDPQQPWDEALSLLTERLPELNQDILEHEGVIALVGPSGVGKTTTIAKLAARIALRHGREAVSLVTTDAYRIGAYRQLQTFGQILGVPVHLAQTKRQLHDILEGMDNKRLVLIDTAGIGPRDARLAEEFSTFASIPGIRSLLVLAANMQRESLEETMRAYGTIRLSGCVLTKLDETSQLGGALSALAQLRLPLAYVSEGQQVPENLDLANVPQLVNRAVAMLPDQKQARAVKPSATARVQIPMANHYYVATQ